MKDVSNARAAAAITLPLAPVNHLRKLDPEGTWEAVGNDPSFRCVLPADGLEAGWYEVELDIEQSSGPEMWPYFYPDYGDHEFEQHKVYLPLIGDGVRRGIALFTNDVQVLRFDPAVTVCRFKLGRLNLRKIGKREAGTFMLSALARRPSGMATKLYWIRMLATSLLLGGLSGFAQRLYGIYAQRPEGGARVPYQTWLDLYDPRTPQTLERARQLVDRLADKPMFSVILPVYNTPEKWLRKCIDSVRRQAYENWELCIANDASPASHVRRVLDSLVAQDPRIRVVHREVNGHIAACSNSAVGIARGEWLVLLDHDDELHPLALAEVASVINRFPRWRVIYSDEDKIDENGQRYDPYMKPDWNYDLFLSHNCVSHLGVYDAALVRDVGGFRVGMEGSQDWDLALRCIERIGPDQIGHIPKVLYHWRAIQGSTALAPQEKNYAHDAGLRAIGEHLQRIGSDGKVEEIPGLRGNYRVRYPVPEPAPLTSIIVPTRDRVALLRACVESIGERTSYPHYEILIVDNGSVEKETLDYLAAIAADDRIRVLRHDGPFNYSAINNRAAREARGSVLCLLNNDITVISPEWLDEMVGHACRPGVGAVGAMLYYPNDTIQHAGVVIGAHGIAAHAYSGHRRGHPGHMSRARLTQSLSAVTAACLVVHRELFERVGGLDPLLEVAFNDVDFCLKLGKLGYRNVWTPFAELYHHESATRGYETSPEKMSRFNGEVIYMKQRWGDVLQYDPAYSPNLSIVDEIYQLAFPPRDGWPGPTAAWPMVAPWGRAPAAGAFAARARQPLPPSLQH